MTVDFIPPSAASTACFEALLAGVVFALVFGVRRASLRGAHPARAHVRAAAVGAGTALWLLAYGLVVESGVVASAPFPRLMLLFAAANGVAVALALSPVGRWLATGLSLGWLVAFQGFRLPLELLLHDWVSSGSIPATMTWTGSNFDIVSGVSALLAAGFVARSRALAWAVNVLGMVLLANVMRVAVLSSPLPFAWPVSPPLLLALHLPYAFILPVCVGGALAGHVVLTRALLRPSGR
jgi:hypothetical protein